jgi:tRNA pseudouridine55 synthase
MPPAISTDALLLVDKPAGITSFDVVRAVRRATGARKVGHTGTLDPFATGLLVILTGRATRLMSHVPGEPKVYAAVIRFGEERETDDVTGVVTRTAPPPDPSDLPAAIARLTGVIQQVPPAYSAKKVDGARAYALARRGDAPDLAPSTVRVDAWEVLGQEGPRLQVRIRCGAGTYIRALARDLGREMQSAACLESLRRERAGPFAVDDADPWPAVLEGRLTHHPVREALADLPSQVLGPDDARRIAHGMSVPATADAARAALLDESGALLAVARRDGDSWRPEVVLAGA